MSKWRWSKGFLFNGWTNKLAGELFGKNNGKIISSYCDQEKSNITFLDAKEEKTSF